MSEQEPPESAYPQYDFAPVSNSEGEPHKTQSKLGIASFIIGLVSLILIVVAIFVSTSFIMDHIKLDGNSDTLRTDLEDQLKDANDVMPIIVAGLMMLLSFGSSLVGLILGIVGACAKDKKKTFPVIGIILNALLPVGLVCLFVLGVALNGSS
ncbi:hypothetical protein [Paenibacillus sacheonensis]|uniref:DUF4064 domain-containing protein n=1 Tax=Paenibacillus sacheonensis TaxID=742054 RepID=A0A7X5C1R8_9BACL|nr:hypothetical protein [Paenibacillus sacheonensis]MBM7565378.1 hypothetical protein [Paenibacillus sacheonensis]NBC69694.1 hypothetical protein [Paenibacillus sacheonensis]